MNTVYMISIVLCYSDYSDRLHYLQYMHMKNCKKENTASYDRVSVGAKLRYIGYFASFLHPQEEKSWLLFSVRDMSGSLRNPCFIKFYVVNFL